MSHNLQVGTLSLEDLLLLHGLKRVPISRCANWLKISSEGRHQDSREAKVPSPRSLAFITEELIANAHHWCTWL